VIPFSDERTGLRDYRAPARNDLPRRGWLWLVLLVGLIILLDLVLAQWFRLGVPR
jgi:hypothetical protein